MHTTQQQCEKEKWYLLLPFAVQTHNIKNSPTPKWFARVQILILRLWDGKKLPEVDQSIERNSVPRISLVPKRKTYAQVFCPLAEVLFVFRDWFPFILIGSMEVGARKLHKIIFPPPKRLHFEKERTICSPASTLRWTRTRQGTQNRGLCVFSPHGGTTCFMGGDEQSKWELFRTFASWRNLPFGTEWCWKIIGTAHAGLCRTCEQLDCALHRKFFFFFVLQVTLQKLTLISSVFTAKVGRVGQKTGRGWQTKCWSRLDLFTEAVCWT